MHTTVHIFSTLDGRISGPFMFDEHCADAREEYGLIREKMGSSAILYGATTAKGFAGAKGSCECEGEEVAEGDFLGSERAECADYVVSIDPEGEVWWKSAALQRPGRPDACIIEVLCARTSSSFRAYLQSKGIPYIISGEDELDCKMAIDKLEDLFGIKTLMICGGGLADWTFLESGCVDEVSVVIAPAVSGDPDAATSFDWTCGLNEGSLVSLELQQVKPLPGNGVHLLYRVPKRL